MDGTEETGQQEPARPASEQLRVADRNAPLAVVVAIAVVASILGVILGILIDWFPVAASSQAKQVDTFYDVLIAASVPVFVAVTAVVLYCAYQFRMRPGEEDMDGPPIHGNTRLEVIWTTIPALMMLALCSYAYVELHNAEKAPAAAQKELHVRVVGQQFTWTFYYPQAGGKEIASPQLYLPIGRSVKFKVQTKDVLHDFWVPAFRWKIDAVPGVNTGYRVTPTRLGSYPVVCAELCGLGHAVMRQTAHVVPEAAFQDWLAKKGSPGGATGGGGKAAAPDGKALFAANGCGGCHTFAAAGSTGATGPNLDTGLKGQTAAQIKEDIVNPNAQITKGYGPNIMPPNFGQSLSPAEIDALVKYIQQNVKG